MASGSAGNYPLKSAALGWAQPWGVAYGGMSGGDEINIFDGLRTDFRKIKMHPDPGCALCGPDATIKSLL